MYTVDPSSITNNLFTGNSVTQYVWYLAFPATATFNSIHKMFHLIFTLCDITGNFKNTPNPIPTLLVKQQTVFNYNLFENPSFSQEIQFTGGSSLSVNASLNWWGTNNATDVALRISDFFTSSAVGVVDYFPFLSDRYFTAPIVTGALPVISTNVTWSTNMTITQNLVYRFFTLVVN